MHTQLKHTSCTHSLLYLFAHRHSHIFESKTVKVIANVISLCVNAYLIVCFVPYFGISKPYIGIAFGIVVQLGVQIHIYVDVVFVVGFLLCAMLTAMTIKYTAFRHVAKR